MTESVLLVGTKKGLWIGRADGSRQDVDLVRSGVPMQGVYATCIDTRGDAAAAVRQRHQRALRAGRLPTPTTSVAAGPRTRGQRSQVPGRTWAASVERVWQIQPGRPDEPDVFYAGTQPSALFRSTDRGGVFELVRSLWDHPHRPDWGAGFGGQAIHTIVPHPTDQGSGSRWRCPPVASTRPRTAGESWNPANKGIKAYFFPDPWPEFGQCVHKVAAHPARPERMYAQNHHGVYRSDDGGDQWTFHRRRAAGGLRLPDRGASARPGHRLRLPAGGRQRADPARRAAPGCGARPTPGQTWTPSTAGLPDRFFAAVMRDAMTADNADQTGLYLGARDGTVFASSTTARPGPRSSHTCPTCCRSGPLSSQLSRLAPARWSPGRPARPAGPPPAGVSGRAPGPPVRRPARTPRGCPAGGHAG